MIRQNEECAVIVCTAVAEESAPGAIRGAERLQTKNVLIKSKGGLANVGLHQIEYVEYRDHALSFHLSDGRAIPSRVIHQSFSWVVENTLNDPRFVKPHASYVVNMDRVRTMTDREFEMDCGAGIPISKRVYGQVKRKFIDYMVHNNGASIL